MAASRLEERATAYVLDASAVLAMLQSEPGGERIWDVLERSVISSVNWSEVVQKSREHGVVTVGMRAELQGLGLSILAFTTEDAETTAQLRQNTRHAGLSLGDRACLALAQRLELVAITADRAWLDLPLDIPVQILR